jgi:hypothetical protein
MKKEIFSRFLVKLRQEILNIGSTKVERETMMIKDIIIIEINSFLLNRMANGVSNFSL